MILNKSELTKTIHSSFHCHTFAACKIYYTPCAYVVTTSYEIRTICFMHYYQHHSETHSYILNARQFNAINFERNDTFNRTRFNWILDIEYCRMDDSNVIQVLFVEVSFTMWSKVVILLLYPVYAIL